MTDKTLLLQYGSIFCFGQLKLCEMFLHSKEEKRIPHLQVLLEEAAIAFCSESCCWVIDFGNKCWLGGSWRDLQFPALCPLVSTFLFWWSPGVEEKAVWVS